MLSRSKIAKWAAATGVAGALLAASAAPTFADAYDHRYRHHPAGIVGGVIGGAVTGATALATAPFRALSGHDYGPYAYDYGPAYRPGYDAYAYAPAPFGDPAAGQCATEGAQGRIWYVC